VNGKICDFSIHFTQNMEKRDLSYRLRDQGGIPTELLQEAWQHLGKQPHAGDQILEVGGTKVVEHRETAEK